MRKTSLLIVDVQNCFVNGNTDHLPERIKEIISKYPEVVFTRFVNHDGSNFATHGYLKCKDEQENAIHPILADIAAKHKVFTKNTFSAFKAEGLIEYLRENEIEEVHICGTDTEACVMASAYEAFDLGFRVRVLSELCASCNGKKYHNAGVMVLERNLGFATGNRKP
jgi:nicotinamidase-related amidase